jgi:hypothetical protein
VEKESKEESWQDERAASTNLKWYLYLYAATEGKFNEDSSNENEDE